MSPKAVIMGAAMLSMSHSSFDAEAGNHNRDAEQEDPGDHPADGRDHNVVEDA